LLFLFFNAVQQIYNTLGSRRSALKKEARQIVEKQYALIDVDGEEGQAARIALKVQGLLNDAGDFTDGPSDHNVSQICLPQRKV
jgi:hypothetical protein